MGIVENWAGVKEEHQLEVDQQYSTDFGVYIPGSDITLIAPSGLNREPDALKKQWDVIFHSSGSASTAARMGEMAKAAAAAFYRLLKERDLQRGRRYVRAATSTVASVFVC